MTVINTNIAALRAQNGSRMANSALSTAMERLSSGKRINSAKDDAAGLAIATRMSAQVKGLNVAIRNANDGISLAQTADSALGGVSNMLQRMRELAVQSANGTNSSSDRAALQAELSQLVSEVDGVAKSTTFNGVNLLDGSSKNIKLQIGTQASDTVSFGIAAAGAKDLGLQGYKVDGQLTTGRVGTVSSLAVGDVQINGKDAFASAAAADTAAALATAINSNTSNTNVTATAFNSLRGGQPNTSTFAAGALTINSASVGAAGSVDELVKNINRDVAGVTAVLNDDGTISLSNDTGNNIVVAGSAPTSAGFTAGTYAGYVSLNSANGGAISIKAKDAANGYVSGAGTLADVKAMGLNETSDDASFSGAQVSTAALDGTDDLKVNGFLVGASATGSAASKAAAINAISGDTGVQATAKTQVKIGLDFTGLPGATDVQINGATIDLSSVTNLNDVVTAVNTASPGGVRATSDSNGNLILTSENGADITLADASGTFFASETTIEGQAGTTASGVTTFGGRVTLSSDTNSQIRVEGSSASIAKAGLATQGGTADFLGGAMSIATADGARTAMAQIDKAINTVSTIRGNLGAVQNRLETRVNVLTSSSTNIADAQSRIEDADFSAETTNLAKAQILSQAATAMLAQANQSQQGVLKLLG
jgi:flagellin